MKLRKDEFQFWWLRDKMGRWQFFTDFINFDNICHVILKENFFFREELSQWIDGEKT